MDRKIDKVLWHRAQLIVRKARLLYHNQEMIRKPKL